MSKLKSYKLSELYSLNSGISTSPDQAGHGFPFVSFGTVFNNYFLPENLPDLMQTSDLERQQFSVKTGDIFLTRTSENLDELCMSCVVLKDITNATYSGFLKRLRPRQADKTYHKFMGFYLRSEHFRKTINSNAIMTLRASFNEQIFSYLNVLLPEYKAQKSIGNFLYSIQQKIELNNQINSKLEALAKLIYDYWFVQFDFPDGNGKPYKSSGGKMVYNEALKREIPDGWSNTKLEHIITRSATGLNPRDNFILGEGQNYYITIKSIKDGKIVFDDRCDRVSDNSLEIIDKRSDLRVGDVLFTSIQPVGVTYLILEKPTNWNINESVFSIRANYEKVTSEFLYMMLSSTEIKLFTRQSSSGSIHKGIRHSVLKDFNLPYGGKDITESFSKLVSPILSKSFILDKENQQLEQLRDWLLPLLMNGQVTVSEPGN